MDDGIGLRIFSILIWVRLVWCKCQQSNVFLSFYLSHRNHLVVQLCHGHSKSVMVGKRQGPARTAVPPPPPPRLKRKKDTRGAILMRIGPWTGPLIGSAHPAAMLSMIRGICSMPARRSGHNPPPLADPFLLPEVSPHEESCLVVANPPI